MKEQQGAYRQIIKATSIFGGVQLINIIITIIRSKLIAIWLGPTGMGIVGLLTTASSLISKLSDFGLSSSAVKNVSASYATEREDKIAETIIVLRRWVWITGIVGALLMIVLSKQLSILTFGNADYTLAFVYLSVTMLFNQLSNGQRVLLQGMRKIKMLAKASSLGSLFGLIITVPLYYIYRIEAIVPAIVISSLIALFFTWYYSKKLPVQKIDVSISETFSKGKDMLLMGFFISLGSLLTLGVSYLVRIYINNLGGITQVGLYTVGFAIVNNYIGMIFNAMTTDYYPRLAAVANDEELSRQTINQQAEVALLILSPIMTFFIVFSKWFIIILYSNKFVEITEMMIWASLGIFFKAVSWSVGFIFISKGDYKLLFLNEFISNIYILSLNILGYYLYGLTGLGFSFLISYILHLIQVYLFGRYYYKFSFNLNFHKLFSIPFLMAVACVFLNKWAPAIFLYSIGTAITVASLVYSYRELDRRIGLKKFIKSFRK